MTGVNLAPRIDDGPWLGTTWLRSDENQWARVRSGLAADLDFVQSHRLGRVLRVGIGLDQLMDWDPQEGFIRFSEPSLANFEEALAMFDTRGLTMLAVLYDQEEVGSLGNFHFEALDGRHPAMRENYLRATERFMRRFGSRATVVGWDLFNEAYNSLGTDGQLPKPPGRDPVSPNYPREQVHSWLVDLYRVAKRAAPGAWLTVSDTTELYWRDFPDLTKYEGCLDFYDIHIYDDNPHYPTIWKTLLNKPYIVGEAAADVGTGHYKNQPINAAVVGYLLAHAREAGVSAVLPVSVEDENLFASTRDALTPTGMVLAAFDGQRPPAVAARPVRRPGALDAARQFGGLLHRLFSRALGAKGQ
jgi:hypothetical protein